MNQFYQAYPLISNATPYAANLLINRDLMIVNRCCWGMGNIISMQKMRGWWTNRLHDMNDDFHIGQSPQQKATSGNRWWQRMNVGQAVGEKHGNLTMEFAHSQSPNDFRALHVWGSFENVPSIYMVGNWSRNCGIMFSSGSFSNGYGLWLIAMIKGGSCWLIWWLLKS